MPDSAGPDRQPSPEDGPASRQTLDTPAARARWRLAHKLKRYNLTQERFDRLLEAQGFACAMCKRPFQEDQPVFIDHDHACCRDEKRKYALARAYLDSPPRQALTADAT
ncbi:MAG TPA: endonuclease domain-containing protein [Trebonia sp.]|jgi:hypothetical protein|nr:endonuclease domain-containing protein [Trebonia sp.]